MVYRQIGGSLALTGLKLSFHALSLIGIHRKHFIVTPYLDTKTRKMPWMQKIPLVKAFDESVVSAAVPRTEYTWQLKLPPSYS